MRAAGVDAAFRELYERHHDELWRYTARRVASQSVAGVVSDIFLVAWRRLDEVPSEPDTRAWLYVVARNCVSNQLRGQRRQGRLIRRVEEATVMPTEHAPADDVRAALTQLSEADRELLRLLYWEDLSPAAAARVLGLTPNAVAIRAHRARTKLRGLLTTRKDDSSIGHEAVMHEVNNDEQ